MLAVETVWDEGASSVRSIMKLPVARFAGVRGR